MKFALFAALVAITSAQDACVYDPDADGFENTKTKGDITVNTETACTAIDTATLPDCSADADDDALDDADDTTWCNKVVAEETPVENDPPAECVDEDGDGNDDVSGEACPVVEDATPVDDVEIPGACTKAEDCAEEEVCMKYSVEWDEDHEDYVKEDADLADAALAAFGICMTGDDCDAEEVPSEYADYAGATVTISCGATKLVAGFAALALAAAM